MMARGATGSGGAVLRRASSATLNVWRLRPYVMGRTPPSMMALTNPRKFCKTQLKGRYHIRVIDLAKRPQLAKNHQILAVPTVLRMLPKPLRDIVGTLSDAKLVLVGLDLCAAG